MCGKLRGRDRDCSGDDVVSQNGRGRSHACSDVSSDSSGQSTERLGCDRQLDACKRTWRTPLSGQALERWQTHRSRSTKIQATANAIAASSVTARRARAKRGRQCLSAIAPLTTRSAGRIGCAVVRTEERGTQRCRSPPQGAAPCNPARAEAKNKRGFTSTSRINLYAVASRPNGRCYNVVRRSEVGGVAFAGT